MEKQDAIIQISNLNKHYGDKHVLNNITIDVRKGECLGVIGKNGAGKTTMFECIENIKKWESGSILIKGKDITKNGKAVKKVLGVQLQSSSLPNDIKVEEAIKLFAVENHVKYSKKEYKELYKKFSLEENLQKRYKQLSTGQKRRVHLLIAILHDPEIVILDEPTAGLDIEGKDKLYNVIKELMEQGKTFLISSHDMQEVEKLCDRVAFVLDGKIVKIEDMNSNTLQNENTVICVKMHKAASNDQKKFSFGEFIEHDNGYDEYRCTSIISFLKEFIDSPITDDNEIQDIFIRKSSIEKELVDLIKGDEQ